MREAKRLLFLYLFPVFSHDLMRNSKTLSTNDTKQELRCKNSTLSLEKIDNRQRTKSKEEVNMRWHPILPYSLLLTAFISKSCALCENDLSYGLGNMESQNCYQWFRHKEHRRQDICSKVPNIRATCQKTCGLCCGNDIDFRFIAHDGSTRSCAWMNKGSQETKRKRRRENCGKYSPDDIMVKEAW